MDPIYIELATLLRDKLALSKEDIAPAERLFKPVDIKKGQHLLVKGQIADRLFFINKGCLRLYYSNENLSMATRFMAFEHTFLTSIVSFISRNPSAEYIEAVEESQLLAITHQDFFRLRSQMPVWDKVYVYILEYGLTVINNRLSGLITQNATERYRNLLRDNPELIQRLSNVNLASYLNISPETLSRIKSNL